MPPRPPQATTHPQPQRPNRRGTPPRSLTAATGLVLLVLAAFAALLAADPAPGDQDVITAVGLFVGGLLSTVSCWVRASWSTGRRRRAWRLFAVAGSIAVVGNLGVALVGGVDPVAQPSLLSDLSVAVALVLAVAGVLYFPGAFQRGLDLGLLLLDSVLIGGAVLLTAGALAWSDLAPTGPLDEATEVTALLVPLLDVALVTVALALFRRTRGADRRGLVLVTAGFVVYAVTDLFYAVLVARGTFVFGTPVDLGWLVGYLMLALAAWFPSAQPDPDTPDVASPRHEVSNTGLVFGALLVAALTQMLVETSYFSGIQALLWAALVVTVGVRQTLVSRDHARLRGELECRVSQRTADLRQLVRETEVLVSSVADGIYGVDLEGRITFVNPSGAATLGYSAEQLRGRRAHDFFHAPREDGTPYPLHSCYVTEAVRQLAVTSSEDDVYVRADGSTLPVEITASPVLGEDRQVTGGVVVFRDATARREVERMKNEFLSVVSHELRTPLTSIRGALELMSAGALGELPAPATGMVRRAQQSSERLTRMINDILDLERLESGAVAITLTGCRADALLRAAAREMTGLSQAAGVAVLVEDTDLTVRADFDRVVQALTNLVGNAVKFSDPGSQVVLSAAPATTSAPAARGSGRGHPAPVEGGVVLRVVDQGRGIPPEQLERVFDRFEQVDSSDVRQHAGSGLGLAICRGIVEAHGGRIWADSEVGAGTTMSFTLPADLPVPDPRPSPRGRTPQSVT